MKNSSGQSQSIYQQQAPSSYRPQSPPNLGNRVPGHANGVGNRTSGSRMSGGPPSRVSGTSHNRGPRTAEDGRFFLIRCVNIYAVYVYV